MKKRRLSVRIDGVWYRVAHGKLHKITREVTSHAARSDIQPQTAKAYSRDSRPKVSDEALVGENMTTLTMCSPEKKLSYKLARRSPPYFSRRQRRFVALPDNFHTHNMPTEATRWQRSSWKHKDVSSGAREDHTVEPGVASDIDGLCSFVRGRPQQGHSQELDGSGQVSDSGESSSMSTATSARKPLVIRIKMTKVAGQ
ncbi:hypothetical protein O6H91_16G093600 [Diphasiastrum complanatum]|uniref:Uncharacterized protein n=1 Tax=Diphasiastrum complanatum TaxID=34168 RepID=A0ACC2BEN4_DIPCM|nr:hypothetical protein O6H91_16G093600 [Diphasiastrum complanatum]